MNKNTELTAIAHIKKVDMLRAVAIIAVFLFHSINCLFPNYSATTYTEGHTLAIEGTKNIFLNFNPFAFGWSGVHLFLLISGFLIHLSYLSNKETMNIRTFYSKRFWRIYPPYLVVLIFLCIFKRGLVYYFFSKVGLIDFFSHVFLLHNFSDATIVTIDSPFWSLALEAQLYVIYPLLLYFRKKITMKNTFLVILALSLVLQIVGIITHNFGTTYSYDWSLFKLWFVWAAGALLAETYHNGKTVFGKKGLMVSVLFLLILTASKYFSFTSYFQAHIATLMWFAFFEWFIVSEKIKTTSILSKAMIAIGLCSYSIYLIHMTFLHEMFAFFSITHYSAHSGMLNNINLLAKVSISFIIIFLISYSMYIFIEQKSISFGKKWRSGSIK